MTLLHLVVLAVVQGITEFLPISSSGHLVLIPVVFGWPDQGLLVDVAVHVGTLGAVMAYFWRDLWLMLAGLGRLLRGRADAGARLAGFVVVGTLPLIPAGFLVDRYLADWLRSIEVIAWASIGFGFVLYAADRLGMTVRRIEHVGWGDAVVIGLAQVLALIPGTSRSGITMSAGRMLGLERTDAARFSMLLSIPAIVGAGALKSWDLYRLDDPVLTGQALLAGGLAFVTALVAIAAMMAWLRNATFTPFVVYRVVLGLVLLGFAYGWFA